MFPRCSKIEFYCRVSQHSCRPFIVVVICYVADSSSEIEYVVLPYIASLTEGFNVTMVNIEKR